MEAYKASDPFFIVTCRDCGRGYWSTRQTGGRCIFCGSPDIQSRVPGHTIERERCHAERT